MENPSEPYQILGMRIVRAPYLVVKVGTNCYRCLSQNRHGNGTLSVYIRYRGGCRQGGGLLKRQPDAYVSTNPVAFYERDGTPDPEAHLYVVET